MTKQMFDELFGLIGSVIVCTLLVSLFVGCWAVQSCCEADAYNRVTGKNVTTWDAMFLDLRVQEQVKD